MSNKTAKVALNVGSALLVIFLAWLLGGTSIASYLAAIYLPVSFLTVAGADFYRTQVKEDGQSEVAFYQNSNQNRGVYVDEHGFVRVAPIGQAASAEQPAEVVSVKGHSFVDRFLAYLFIAPLIFPATIYRLVAGRP